MSGSLLAASSYSSKTIKYKYTERKIIASDAASDDYFGSSVSVSGNLIVVGSTNDDHSGRADAGSAYVYRYNGTSWVQEQQLTASDAASNDYFGTSVSVSGNLIVVGSIVDDHGGFTDAGSAYVYRYNGTSWVQEQKLTASDAATNEIFGWSVSISDNVIVVGSKIDDHSGFTEAGSAYVYRYNGTSWVQEQKLTASDSAGGDNFGWSVSVSGDLIVVGSAYDNHSGFSGAGSAYVYRYNGTSWVQEQKLTASDSADGENFGWSVSISDNVIVVGSAYDDHGGFNGAGSAYVYRYNGTSWVQEQKLTASDPVINDFFGTSVSVSGNLIVVGSTNDDHGGFTDAGSAYVYRYNGTSWVQEQKLTASDSAGGDNFGFSVSVSDDIIVVGAYLDDHSGFTDAGSAYVYTIELNVDWSTWTSGMVSSTNLNMPTTAVLESNGYIPNSWNFWDNNFIGSTNRSMPTTATIESDGYISNSWDYWSVDQVSSININMSSTATEINADSVTICNEATSETQTVTGSLTGTTVWGSNPYTQDSDFAVAAVHAGLVAPGATATITKNFVGYLQNYSGTTANGVTTTNWTTGWCGVEISLASGGGGGGGGGTGGGSGGSDGSGYNSVNFDGSSYLNGVIPALGAGDFTVECWVLFTNTTEHRVVWQISTTSGGLEFPATNGLLLKVQNNTLFMVAAGGSGGSLQIVTTNIWYHVVISRINGSTTLTINGEDNVSIGGDSVSYGGNFAIGGGYGSQYLSKSFISNFRIVRGSAVYPSGVSVPTSPLTAITNTALLTCRSESIVDNSINNVTITKVGNAFTTSLNPFL